MRLCTTIASLAVGCVLTAAEPAMQALVPDLTRLEARLRATGWAGVLDAPGLASWLAVADRQQPSWRSLLRGTGQARLRLDWTAPVGGLPAISATWAIGSPAEVPKGERPLFTALDGAWRFCALSPRDLTLPELPAVAGTSGHEDVLLRLRLEAVRDLLGPARAPAWGGLLPTWRLDQLHLLLDLSERAAERIVLPGARLPLRPVQADALTGLPPSTHALIACGVDGPALAAALPVLAALVGGGDPQAVLASLDERLGLDWTRAGAAIDGTIVIARTGDPAAPGLVVGLPAAVGDPGVLQRWLTSAHPEPDETVLAAIRSQVEAASEQVVSAGTIAGVPLFMRRTADRFWLASAPALLAGCVPDAAPFPVAERWPDAAGAAALAWWGEGVLARLAVRAMPAALAGGIAGMPTPAGWMQVRQDDAGVSMTGRAGATAIVPLAALAVAAAPALGEALRSAAETALRARMQLILQRCISFRAATSEHWPRDIADLRAWAKDLTDDDLTAPGRPELRPAFVYVPPAAGAPADQPVLVEDPAARSTPGSLVGFADGSIRFMPGRAHWDEARRLLAKPDLREHGVTADEWATRPKTF